MASKTDRRSLHQEVTDQIISELEQGRVPWVQPWGTVPDRKSPARSEPPSTVGIAAVLPACVSFGVAEMIPVTAIGRCPALMWRS